MIQDRNIHRDALALQRSVAVEMFVPLLGVDQDEPMWHITPRYNWRLTDLSTWTALSSGGDLTISAAACPLFYALGNPRCLPGVATPMVEIDDYWRSLLVNDIVQFIHLTVPARPFTGPGIATVLDGFWGVWLWQNASPGASVQEKAFAAAPVMSFGTEEIALANCPKVRDLGDGEDQGRLCILTVHAVGGDFIAGTTNTDAALVAAFNTAPQAGHVVTISAQSRPQAINAVLGTQLKDASGTNLIQGRGGVEGEALVVMTKCFGGPPPPPTLAGPAQALVSYRPWPAGGEGLGDLSVSQTKPGFAP